MAPVAEVTVEIVCGARLSRIYRAFDLLQTLLATRYGHVLSADERAVLEDAATELQAGMRIVGDGRAPE